MQERRARWRAIQASGAVIETRLGTTQGRLGMERLSAHEDEFAMEGTIELDQSNNGCTIIAYMIAALALLNLLSSIVVEHVIDSYCQDPLKKIRSESYPGKGFALVSSEEALGDLYERRLLPRMNVRSHH